MIDTPERRAQPGWRGGAEQIVGVRRLAALTGRGWKAVAGAADRVFEQRAPADRRAQHVAAHDVGFPPSRHDPGHRQRRRAAASGIAAPNRAR